MDLLSHRIVGEVKELGLDPPLSSVCCARARCSASMSRMNEGVGMSLSSANEDARWALRSVNAADDLIPELQTCHHLTLPIRRFPAP
ncbi:hypothetical protein THAOC_19232 [Thalassiosira oceanica]|uniref:Uncharacterized protein n=1 Tax=Thalassiosira oceanica TaxID=159749 RepID=K0SHC9_THAOC|nr:hypothetical protein THAOC_19232 [Thalassiosira oceanica]|mmetsp:Transcript_29821/g.70913  ORF Transcript_29821/g.70913 Transcript_29821/m.70913 type:complete len:87 (-) Transcript_29821:37-297(-)|eukprot:EJK60421.1 hypothetical protein THAOC_19232 [Thalassiosira oceanica]